MSKVCIFHTGISTFAPLQALAQELMPGVEFMHIVEDAMIKDVMKAGGPDADISARIALYVMAADRAKCDIFMTACSSIGEVVEECRRITRMTITRIDEAMVAAAIARGGVISVLATVETTLRPTLNLVHRKAAEQGKKIELRQVLMADAFRALLGRRHRHPQPDGPARGHGSGQGQRRAGAGAGLDGPGAGGPRHPPGAGPDLAGAGHAAPQGAGGRARAAAG